MRHDKNLSEELLRQNGIEAGKIPDAERKELQQMIAKDQAAVRRMKWATIVSWVLVPVVFIAALIFEASFSRSRVNLYERLPIIEVGIIVCYTQIIIAIVLTVSFFVRSRSASLRQIQASLSDIQQQLERVAKERGGQDGQ